MIFCQPQMVLCMYFNSVSSVHFNKHQNCKKNIKTYPHYLNLAKMGKKFITGKK